MFQWRSARRTSGEKEGTWQEKVPSSAGEGRGGGPCQPLSGPAWTETAAKWDNVWAYVLCVHKPNMHTYIRTYIHTLMAYAFSTHGT